MKIVLGDRERKEIKKVLKNVPENRLSFYQITDTNWQAWAYLATFEAVLSGIGYRSFIKQINPDLPNNKFFPSYYLTQEVSYPYVHQD